MDGHLLCHASLWVFSAALLWCSIYLLSHDCAKQNFKKWWLVFTWQKIICVFHVICAFLKIFYRSVAPITTQSKYIFSAPSLIPPSTIPFEEVILCLKMNKRREWAIIPARMHLVRSFYSAKSLFALFFVLCLGLSSALITTFRRITSFLSLAQNSVGDLQGFLCVLYIIIQEFSFIQIRSHHIWPFYN